MTELETAIKEARSLSSNDNPPHKNNFIGAMKRNDKTYYFYRTEEGYVYETDYIREMRAKQRKNKLKRCIKK